MENILSQFNAGNLEIKLTNEKLFINTATSSETFALRSVNGIGVVDLVDEYNKALTAWKIQRLNQKIFLGIGIFLAVIGFYILVKGISLVIGFLVFGSFLAIVSKIGMNKTNNEPKLMSAVRIMMSGGNRDFQFDKTGIKSENVAEFVAKVESTLTSYHKNND
jgi:hypothetical protein